MTRSPFHRCSDGKVAISQVLRWQGRHFTPPFHTCLSAAEDMRSTRVVSAPPPAWASLRLNEGMERREDEPATCHQGRYGEEGMPRVTKGV